jgi:hypothetical protein
MDIDRDPASEVVDPVQEQSHQSALRMWQTRPGIAPISLKHYANVWSASLLQAKSEGDRMVWFDKCHPGGN